MSQPSLGRRLQFGALALALGLGFVEVLANVALMAVTRRGFSRAEISQTLVPVAEGGAATQETSVDMFAHFSLHPFAGLVHNPAKKQVVLPGQPKADDVNPLGFYGTSPLADRAPEALRVAITGGSVAAAQGSFWQTRPEALATRLEKDLGRPVEIVNLAILAWKQPQQLMGVSYLLLHGLDIDLLINLDGFNEVALSAAENLPMGIGYDYPRSWQLVAGGTLGASDSSAVSRIRVLRSRLVFWRGLLSSRPLRYSALVLIVWDKLHREIMKDIWATERAQRKPSEYSFGERGHFTMEEVEGAPEDELVDLWAESSVQLHQLLTARGIGYLHALQPNQYDPASKKLLTEEEKKTGHYEKYVFRDPVERGYPKLREAVMDLRSRGVSVVDLSRVFDDVEETLWVDVCCHFNQTGQAKLTDALYPELLKALR